MENNRQRNWNIASLISFCVSGFMVHKGYDKITNYYNSDTYSSLNTNSYVGGDAYNYIINSNYATGYYVLALMFVVIGVGCILAGYLDKMCMLKENSIPKETKAELFMPTEPIAEKTENI